jgi:CRISPR/Cas system Type II protein with McrA/HNH and RuvC-like nuclease domain
MSDTSHSAIDRLHQSAERFEVLISRMEATARRECDCNLAALRRENERLLDLLRAHPPPKPAMLPQRRLRLAAAQSWKCAICGELLEPNFHADHRVPWSETFDDSDENIQIVNYACHQAKTSVEQSCRRRQTSS